MNSSLVKSFVVGTAVAAVTFTLRNERQKATVSECVVEPRIKKPRNEPSAGEVVSPASRIGADGKTRLAGAIRNSRRLVKRVMLEQGVPGAVLTVAKDGVVVMSEGFGLADVENDTPCTPESGKLGYQAFP